VLQGHPRVFRGRGEHTLRRLRPPRPDIAVPPLPAGLDWVGQPVDSIDRLVAARPAIVHFFDFAQLNSVRTVPYLRAWHERYRGDGLAMIGIHSPRFPFTRHTGVVTDAVNRLGIDWSVAVDPEFHVWRLYEPHGWPALFLWGRGGALHWYHVGEGDYTGTEEAIREALAQSDTEREWPPLVEPLRPSDAAGAKVVPPTREQFPGGSTEEPLTRGESDPPLEVAYEAGGAYAATDGEGEIRLRLDGEPLDAVMVTHPGLQELALHERSESHTLELEPSPRVRLYSLQFAAGVP
jgi:hypothetical protein